MNRKILITGSTGFVGVNLVKYLSELNYDVYTLNKEIDLINKNKNYTWEELDSVPLVDVIIHLAGKAHDTKNITNAKEYYEVNTKLTERIYNFYLSRNIKTFIFFSSVKAAADTVSEILNENVIPNPQTDYGKSKLQAEEYILSNLKDYTYILRPCMIHGKGNKGNLNLLYNFISKKIPYPLACFENSRSMLGINNLNFLLGKIIESKIPSGIYNLADDESISTKSIIDIMYEVKGEKSKHIKIPKMCIRFLAVLGNFLPLPLNEEKLKKLTETYLVSNEKIKRALSLKKLPYTCSENLEYTIKNF